MATSGSGYLCEQPECVSVRKERNDYKRCYERLLEEVSSLKSKLKDQMKANEELNHKTAVLQQQQESAQTITSISNQDHSGDTNGAGHWFYSRCECSKLKQRVEKLQHVIEDKNTKLQSLTTKVNSDFRYHQGNSMDDGDVNKLWNDLFRYQAERDIPKLYALSKKNEIRRVFCDMFMEIDGTVQKELINRMVGCLRAIFTGKPDLETDRKTTEVQRAFSILNDHIQIPMPKLDEGSVDLEELFGRMADCLRALFTPEFENSKINLKKVLQAFSILVRNLNVEEEEFKLSPEIQINFQKYKQSYKLKNMDKFVRTALSLCVRMRTRVPPYISSIHETKFDPELHELKFVKGGPTPDFLQKHPEVPVIYLRPIVYYNYQGKVYIPGSVVSSYTSIDTTGTAGSSDSTNPQQPTADTHGEGETDSAAEYFSSNEN